MKKQLLSALVLVLPFLASAQTTIDNVQLGFTATPNIGWLRFNDDDAGTSSDGGRIGFSYGVLGDFSLAQNQNYYFATAFTVTTINGKANIQTDASLSNPIYKIQYIEVPLTLKLKSNPQETGRFYGQFGLGTGIKIGAKQGGIAGSDDVNISKKINNFRLSLIAGGGAEWQIDKNMALLTGLTFNNGFTDILDRSGNAKSSYIAFNLGILF